LSQNSEASRHHQ